MKFAAMGAFAVASYNSAAIFARAAIGKFHYYGSGF
jgi:hypothetical protein